MSVLLSSDSSLSKEELLLRLEEAEETLRAIRSGEVDALVVSGEQGDQVFTLKDATLPYQVLIEEMNEGALIISTKGVILYCNSRFAEMLDAPMHTIVGQPFLHYVLLNDQVSAMGILEQRMEGKSKGELILKGDQAEIPVAISLKEIRLDGELRLGAVVSDLSERKKANDELLRYQKHLEDLVEERTRDLKAGNESLRDSRKAALNLMLDAVAARQQADAANEKLQQEIIERKLAEEALRAANEELRRFNQAMVGRELRMIEMKKEVNELCRSAKQPPRYPLEIAKG